MLNLGNEGIAAVRELQGSAPRQLTALREALHEEMRKAMTRALDAEHNTVHQAAGYAKALRDMCMALESAAFGRKPAEVEKHGPMKKPSATEATNAAAR